MRVSQSTKIAHWHQSRRLALQRNDQQAMTLGCNGGARVLAVSTHDGLRCIKAQPKKDEVSCSEYNDSENKGNQSKEGLSLIHI